MDMKSFFMISTSCWIMVISGSLNWPEILNSYKADLTKDCEYNEMNYFLISAYFRHICFRYSPYE